MSTAARFTGAPDTENTYRAFQQDSQLGLAYAATTALKIKANAAKTLISFAALTGAMTVTANVGDAGDPPYVGDEIDILFAPCVSTEVVTFGTGFQPTGTLSLTAAKYGTATFKFNGTAWQQTGSAVTA